MLRIEYIRRLLIFEHRRYGIDRTVDYFSGSRSLIDGTPNGIRLFLVHCDVLHTFGDRLPRVRWKLGVESVTSPCGD